MKRGLASIYALAPVDNILQKRKLCVEKVFGSPPVTSPAYPPRAARCVELWAVLCTTIITNATAITTAIGLASLLSALDSLLGLVLGLDDSVSDSLVVLLAAAPHHDAGNLDDADDAEEEVDGGEQVVLGLDDKTPAGPDEAGGGQGAVLLQGELLGRAGEVGDAGEDEGPLCEMER